MINELILTGLVQALVLALVAYGIMIPFRILNFPDLTSEGAYPFAGAIYASLTLLDIHPILAVLIASISAGLVGICTALVHLRFKVNTLLAGIIISTMFYSVSLRIMGKPNIALFNHPTTLSDGHIALKIMILLGIIIWFVSFLSLFLKTEKGLRMRAVGLNPSFSNDKGISVAKYTILGLFIANCYTGLAGSLMVQLQSYMDIGMGVGIVIHGLAALMIGESLIGTSTLNKQLLAPLIGALIYQQIQGLALAMGLAPSDLKFLTGAIVLIVIAMQKREAKI